MRKFWIIVCAFIASCLLLVGCGGGAQSNTATLATPTSLKMNNKGVLSWDEVDKATAYEVSLGGTSYTVDTNKQDLTELVTAEGAYTVTVKAKNKTTGSKTASFDFTAVKLSAPTKPVAETDPVTHMVKFVWTGAENVRGYLQQVNDGKWVSNVDGYYSISSTGSYTIAVKAKAYAANGVLYLESDASEKSETYAYQQGPVLSLEAMNVIGWTSDIEFDSYNLWVNGEKVKENVVTTDEGYNLVLGDAPALTKTGEYTLQIEAMKDGNSYWSNILEEVGTNNINAGEIYSFDNRKANFTTIKDGVSVSNEQYHGDSGYSLRFDAQHSEQLNLVKYAAPGHDNDIKFTTIKKVSYWVYVEPIEGYEGDFPASDLPGVKWEKPWTLIQDGQEVKSYKGCIFRATNDVPFGQWTKVEIDNVEMAYDNVLILSYLKTLTENYVIYIDDISFEEVYEPVHVGDAEYKVSYTPSAGYHGSWFAYEFEELDFGVENANKTLTVSMDICGNADSTLPNNTLGLFSVFTPDKDPVDYQYLFFETNKVSSLSIWNTVIVELNTNEEGKCYITAVNKGETKTPYSIFIRSCEIVDLSKVDGTAMPAGEEKTTNANGYYQSAVGLPTTEYAEGTAVTVQMDVYITGSFNEYASIIWVDDVYTTDGGELKTSQTIVDYEKMNANVGKWITVKFDATVRDFSVLRLNPDYATIDVSTYGNAVYLVAHSFKSEQSFNYKNVVITKREVNTDKVYTVADGTTKTSVADGYYQAVVGLPTELAVNTAVNVEMDIYVTGSYNEHSNITSVNMVWSTSGGEARTDKTIVDNATMNANQGKWIHVSFGAMVRDYKVLRLNSAYPTIDTSAYGNAVFLLASDFRSAQTFNYKNVVITEANAAPVGTEKTSGANGYYQSVLGLPTQYTAGTAVTVEMDVFVTGDYDQYTNGIYWVDTVYTTTGGEIKDSTKVLDYATIDANEGKWIHLSFGATVRDFDVLRLGTPYGIEDVSSYGNAVFLVAHSFKTTESFVYKNVTITLSELGVAMPSGMQKTTPNGYYQSIVGLSTNLAVGTEVTVEMDIYVTGTIDQYSTGIEWIGDVWSTSGGESKNSVTIVDKDTINANAGKWIHVAFEAKVCNFPVLRLNTDYATIDMTAYGNSVYLMANGFKTEQSFNYKNVSITEKTTVA